MKQVSIYFSRFLLTLLAISAPLKLQAAACCGGGSSGASLITGDYQAQFSLSSSYSSVVAMQTGDKALFWEDGHHQRTLTHKVSIASMISENSQVGLSVEYLKKEYSFQSGSSESSQDLGDLTTQFGYELLAESYYTSYLPRILLGLAHTLPTGVGVEESNKPGLSDVTGLGRHQTSLSLLFLKRRPNSMISLKLETHQRWRRARIGASNGHSFELSASYLPPKVNWNLGAGFGTIFNNGREVKGAQGQSYRSSFERVSEIFLFTALSFSNDWESSLRYVDQTLVGPAKNSTLSRTLSLTLTKYLPL